MKIGIIGAKGFIGREIYNSLPEKNRRRIVHGIWENVHYDVIIDANGNSMKHLAQTDPEYDFEASVKPVMHYITRLNYDKYIYISSIDAESPDESNYGFHRKLSERIVKHYCPNFTIVRLCSVIGENMTKGIVYDILHGEKIFVTKNSLLQIISVKEVAKKIPLTFDAYPNGTLRFYSKGAIEVWDICNMFGQHPMVNPDAETQVYDFDETKLGFKTPEEYLKEVFYERMVKPMESV